RTLGVAPSSGRGRPHLEDAHWPHSIEEGESVPLLLMITAHALTKRYGTTTAVDHLTFEIPPGVVTGFLGPNGSGKSTTMRMIMGLDVPDAGSALIGGLRYWDLAWPLREVGGLLDAKAFHPARSARNHLRWLALSNDIPLHRVDEV